MIQISRGNSEPSHSLLPKYTFLSTISVGWIQTFVSQPLRLPFSSYHDYFPLLPLHHLSPLLDNLTVNSPNFEPFTWHILKAISLFCDWWVPFSYAIILLLVQLVVYHDSSLEPLCFSRRQSRPKHQRISFFLQSTCAMFFKWELQSTSSWCCMALLLSLSRYPWHC